MGLAHVKVQAVNDCGSSPWSAEKNTLVDNTTGISAPTSIKVVIYPNPNDGTFFISCSEIISKVIIIDQLGKPIAEKVNPEKNIAYDYRLLPLGVYYIRVETRTCVWTGKMVKV